MTGEKKPPIQLNSEIPPQQPMQPGPVSYMSPPSKSGGGSNLASALIAVVISVALCAFLIFQLTPTKMDFNTLANQVNGLSATAGTLQASLDSQSTRIDNITSTMGDYLEEGDIPDVDSLESNLASLQSKLDALTTRVATLETGTSTGTGAGTTTGKVSLIHENLDPIMGSGSYSWVAKIVNGTDSYQHVSLFYTLVPDRISKADMATTELTGSCQGLITFTENEYVSGGNTTRIVFMQDGPSEYLVAKGGTLTVLMTLKLDATPSAMWSVEGTVSSRVWP